MLRSDQILSTVEMIQKENLDVRTVTMGINLLDCRTGDVAGTCDRIEERITTVAGNFVPTCNDVSRKLGIPVSTNGLQSPPSPLSAPVLTASASSTWPYASTVPPPPSASTSSAASPPRSRRG